jgi:SulP family sulfate permease
VLLVMSAVSSIDTTGLYVLNEINRSLLGQSIKLHLSEVKGPVMDRLQRSELLKQRLGGRVFLSTAAAFSYLTEQAAQETWSI